MHRSQFAPIIGLNNDTKSMVIIQSAETSNVREPMMMMRTISKEREKTLRNTYKLLQMIKGHRAQHALIWVDGYVCNVWTFLQ